MRRCTVDDFRNKGLRDVDDEMTNRLCPEFTEFRVKNAFHHYVDRNSFALEITACHSPFPGFCVSNTTEINWVITQLYFKMFALQQQIDYSSIKDNV